MGSSLHGTWAESEGITAMIDGIITLISRIPSVNEYGAPVYERVGHDVFCTVSSVGKNEFYSAAQAGLDVQFVFRTHPANYEGEDTLAYEGLEYGIVRTYMASLDVLEIYAGQKVGEYGPHEAD